MKFQFIKNCPKNPYTMNKSYRKYNVIDNCKIINVRGVNRVVHYTEMSIEIIPLEYLKEYKH